MRRFPTFAAALSIVVAGFATAPPAGAVTTSETSAQVVAAFNAERAAAGLPAVTLNAEWSRDCALHNHWEALNTTLSHPETPGTPGFTEDGNWAGTHGVLSEGTSWHEGDPWATAPIHLSQMMDPLLTTVGAAESEGFDCLTTWPGYGTPTAPATTTAWYPGQNATLADDEVAAESPSVPGAWVGLPEGTRTGPYIYLYAPGVSGDPDLSDNECTPDPVTFMCVPATQVDPTPDVLPLTAVSQVSLVGPSGPTPVRVVTQAVAEAAGYGGYMPTVAVFIPVTPLLPGASYVLTARLSSGPTPAGGDVADFRYVPTPPQTLSYRFVSGLRSLHVNFEATHRVPAKLTVATGLKSGQALQLGVNALHAFTVTATINNAHHQRLGTHTWGPVTAATASTEHLFAMPLSGTKPGQLVTLHLRVAQRGAITTITRRIRIR